MSIIKKLGMKTPELIIANDYWELYETAGMDKPKMVNSELSRNGHALKKIIDDRNEMLEALIEIVMKFQSIVPTNTKYVKQYQDEFLKQYDIQIKAIEKATCKSWSEITDLL